MTVLKKEKSKNFIWRKLLIVLFWLVVWQVLSWMIGNAILLEGPLQVLKRLLEDLQTKAYYQTVGASLLRINVGLILGILLAVFCSILAWKKATIEEFLSPLVQFLKAAPIACFIVLLLIWTGSENLSFFVAFLVAFPPVYLNMLEGLKKLENSYVEVAKVFHMPFKNKMRYIYLPSVEPYFMSALSLAVGTAFKAGVAAEIIGTPDFSMGERIYMSKIYLDTAGVLSWMLTVIFVSFLCEKLFLVLAKFYFHKPLKHKPLKKKGKPGSPQTIEFDKVSVAFDTLNILRDVTVKFEAGKRYCLKGESGIGKTTVLRCLWKLQPLKSGNIVQGDGLMAGVFQENRLFEDYTAVENIFATGQCFLQEAEVIGALAEILPKDALTKPVKEFSGGMKRRVEIARALLSASEAVLLDEPFNGLDAETKEKTALFIKKYQGGRTILFTSHYAEDVKLLDGEEIVLWKSE